MKRGETSRPSLKRNSAWMLAGRGLRVVVQAGYFVMLARSLGVSEYGAFVGAAALAGILAPFSTLGTGFLLINAVSRDPGAFRKAWGHAVIMTAISAMALTVVGTVVGRFVLPHSVSLLTITLIAVAELGFARLLEICSQAFQALEQLRYTSMFLLGLSFSRMLAAGALMLFFRHPTALLWSALYLAGTILPALIAYRLVSRLIGPAVLKFQGGLRHLREGLYYSISLAAQTIYNDIDKAMLARLSGLASAGLYGAAYRMVDIAFTPISSVLAASFPRFMKHGAGGIKPCIHFARRLVWRGAIYSALVWIVLALSAPLLLPVLGRQYADAVSALRWLAPLVLLKNMHYFGADTLTGAGYQGLRSLIQVCIAGLNVGLNLWILPLYSWRGACWTSLISDGALMIAVWSAVFLLARRAARTGNPPLAACGT